MLIIKQDETAYDKAVEEAHLTFQELVELYLLGRITLSLLRTRFGRALRGHYTTLMLLGLEGREPTESDLAELNNRLQNENRLLDDFMLDLEAGTITGARALWRAGMYAPARGTFIYYTVPQRVAEQMPGLPGDICLGNGLCGCVLDVIEDDGTLFVYWVVNPEKEHCEVCLFMESSSPFIFPE
jgi:hypothetical protein